MTQIEAKVSESRNIAAEPDLAARLLGGEVIVARQALESSGVFREMLDDSIAAVREHMGSEMTATILEAGFERVHEIVPADQIPAMTEAVYRVIEAKAPAYLSRLMPALFGDRSFYFETAPNVRFHIPYDSARQHAGLYSTFAKKRGEGKLTAHGPHRDSWLDCPDNGVNIWIAFGRVRKGNGLTIFIKENGQTQNYTEKGSVADDVALSQPETFDLEPGDCILFHTDQLHGSELNRTNETRFVISFRVTLDKPHFPREHHHSYEYSGLAKGPFRPLATLPAILQPSFATSAFRRAVRRLAGRSGRPVTSKTIGPVPTVFADQLADGKIQPIDANNCVARLSDGSIVAFARRCPHEGADLANGFMSDGQIVCPWHNVPFDPVSGGSPCAALKVRMKSCKTLEDGRVVIAGEAKAAA
ncbi:MAG: phytanoyl-CoA dioxygenase family protein [Sphingomonadales bacterium]|nr:phytanoyl-CoA dioxygenase family protein [Sphingomonadales bacterium]MBP6435495.1 phytanoyl-CoA dioxygenase family protein [Sphingorhabdus sp.]MBK6718342.1 phytanoyl-CoA dioxygenase family protein [Sphingomonadales bacterium]MBK8272659.1 phytanoyl-CoA dioxygenase family protein [Sphingomonadales bacterium]MBK8860386.1 phytanoyl-CoA dioxygenase family protein [Sphingomonadales bacterium]